VEARVFLVQVVKGKQVKQTVGPMPEREAKAHAQRIADALGSKAQVFLLPVKANDGGGAHPSVSVSAHDANLDAARYPSIFNDTNDDGLPDIDDAFGPLSHEGPPIQTEETRLSAVFANVLKVREAYQQQVQTFLAELASEFPGRKVSGRAKTPYSLLQKLIRSYVLDPLDAKAEFKRAKHEGDALMLKDFAGTSIYARDKHDLDQIVAYIDAHYGGANQIEKEDKYADEDAAAPGDRKGYVAVHYVFLRNGVPVELQVKTERIAHLGDASHTPMKNKTLNIPAYLGWIDLVRRADLGDAAAAAQVDPILTSQEGIQRIADEITLRRNPSSRYRWSDNDYADLADYTENPHRGHVEAEWRHNPAAAMMAAGRAALPVLRRLASSPTAQHLASQAAYGALARMAGRNIGGTGGLGQGGFMGSDTVAALRGGLASGTLGSSGYRVGGSASEENYFARQDELALKKLREKHAMKMNGRGTTMRDLNLADYIPWKFQGRVFSTPSYIQSENLESWEIEEIKQQLEAKGFMVTVTPVDKRGRIKIHGEKLRENRAVATDDGEVDADPLPFAPDRYFIGGVDVPLALIKPIRARRKGIVNANTFMRQAYEGQAERRGPVTLAEVGDPHDIRNRYVLLDGNSTYANAAMSGWPTIRATVVDTPAGMLPNPAKGKWVAGTHDPDLHHGGLPKADYIVDGQVRAQVIKMEYGPNYTWEADRRFTFGGTAGVEGTVTAAKRAAIASLSPFK
jgi:hypothetical protein